MPPSIQNFSNHQQSQLIPPSSSQPKHQKIIATVQPYSTTQHTKAIAEPKKESTDEHNNSHQMSQETQTEAVDDAYNKTNAELYAEIEKLNRFRKKVEESSSSLSKNSAQVMSTGFDAIERRHLKFYEERMKMLESKLQVYEASGDEQVKILSKRLEREVQLESRLNVLEDSLMRMEEKNMELEEQNCELEEIENETRLRWQKLEEDYEVMTQRNSELEMSKMTYQEKYEEARDSVEYLEECLQGSEERIKALEVNLKELKRRLAMSQAFIPAVALFQMWRLKKITMPLMITSPKPDHIEVPADHPIHKKLLECQARERQLTQNINDLNRAYQETLENADNLWAQMEKEYKDKIAHYEKMEVSLRSKIQTLERRLIKDTEDAHERIAALEENEYQLKNRAGKLSRELKEQQKKNSELYEELSNSKDEYQKLQAYINGPLADALEKEKRKLRRAEEDLTVVRNALKENETAHKNEQNLLKRQLQKMHKELKNFEVTNGELKEEVETLERRIIELESYRVGDKNRIQELIDELETKAHVHEHNKPLRPLRNNNAQVRSLAQELNQKPMIMPRQKTVIPIERSAFADVIEKFEVGYCSVTFFFLSV